MDGNNIIEEIKLSNGLTVWLSQDTSEPKVYGGMVVRAGAKDSPNSGIAHYFEHIMFKGTDTIGTVNYAEEAPLLQEIAANYSRLKATDDLETKASIQREINKLNIQAAEFAIPNDFNNLINKYGGTGLNAGTSYDYTIFFNTFTPQYLEHWCWLNSERMVKPVFRLFQSELETVYEEKNMYDDNFSTEPTMRVMQKVMAPHPYQYPIIGSSENLKSPDLNEMQAFFEKMYVAGNMALILTGDFRRAGLESLLESTFGRIKKGHAPHTPAPSPRPFNGHELLKIKLPIPMLQASGRVWHTTPSTHDDQIALGVLQDLLSNESKTGRLDKLVLNNELVEASAINLSLNDVGIFGFLSISKPLRGSSSGQKLIMKELQRIIDGDFSEEELRCAKLSKKRSQMLQIENLEQRQRLLSMLYAQGKSWSDLLEDAEKLDALTKKDISDVARKYLTKNFLEIKKKTGRYKKDKLAKPPYDPISAPNSHAKSPFAKKLETISVQELPLRTLDIKKDMESTSLNPSGLANLYRVENPVNDLFTLELIHFRSRYTHPLTRYLSMYLELVGCQKYSADELNAKLQAIGATISFETKENFFLINVTGFDRYFHETVELLHDFLYAPLEEPKKMSKLIQAKEISDKALRKDPNAISNRLMDFVMYGERASFFRSLKLSDLKRLNPTSLLEELRYVLHTELDVHYTGKLAIDEVRDALMASLDTESIGTPWSKYLHLEANPSKEKHIHFLHDSNATQAIVRAYLPIEGYPDDDEIAALRLYNQYCGGGMGSLLFQEIREYRSLAYGVSSSLNLPSYDQRNDLRSHYTFFVGTQADKLQEAITILDKLVHQVPDDTRRYDFAQEAMKSSIYNFYPFFRMRSRTLASYIRQGLPKDLSLLLLDELSSMSLQKLIDVHSRFIAQQPMIFTVVGDRKKIDLDSLSTIAPVREYKLKDLDL